MCDWFLASFTCGVKLLEYRFAPVWIIAKRWKQSPVRWFLSLKPTENVEVFIVLQLDTIFCVHWIWSVYRGFYVVAVCYFLPFFLLFRKKQLRSYNILSGNCLAVLIFMERKLNFSSWENWKPVLYRKTCAGWVATHITERKWCQVDKSSTWQRQTKSMLTEH